MKEFSKRTVCWAQAALVAIGLLGMVVGAGGSLAAQEASRQVVTAYLDYRDVNYNFIQWALTVTKRSSPFKKEPPLSRNDVIRGVLQLGGGASNEMAFAWERHAGKLCLDLNRNLDLTDDPAGVFSNGPGFGGSFQTFAGIHLPLKTPAGECLALVDLNFNNYSVLMCSAALRSFWQGKVTLQGVEWQMGLLSNLFGPETSLESGSVLLRPWTERDEPFSLYGGSLEAFPFSQKLFVGNHAYQLRCAAEMQGSAAKVRVQFTEQEPRLGELKITGDFVQRVTLEGGPYLVVLDRPGAAVKVPVGGYGQAKVSLKKDGTEACLDARAYAGKGRITISEKAGAVLAVGGPLTNSVSLRREGRKLALNYQLLGAGGAYQLVNQDRLHPPEFTVYQGEKKIASGKFQFG